MAEKTINLRGLKCPLPALRARKALTALKGSGLKLAQMPAPASPAQEPLLVLTILIELGGGAAIMLGWKTRPIALVVFLFTALATVVFHAFWLAPPDKAMLQQLMFMKNVSVMGGLLGVKAVIWTDVVQMFIYAAGAGLVAFELLGRIPGGWSEVVRAEPGRVHETAGRGPFGSYRMVATLSVDDGATDLDLVTEMSKVRHPMDAGRKGQRGIEW